MSPQVRIVYNPELARGDGTKGGYVAEVPMALTERHVAVLAERAHRCLSQEVFKYTGDERRVQEARLEDLRQGNLWQRVRGRELNDKGDIDLIPPVPTKSKIISMPGLTPAGMVARMKG